MDTPRTASGQLCKNCLKKGPGERCHVHSKSISIQSVSTKRERSPKSLTPESSARPKAKKSVTPKSVTPKASAKPKAKKSVTPPESLSVMSISPKNGSSLEREFRYDVESPDESNLGWSPSKNYFLPGQYERALRVKHEHLKTKLPMPDKFERVYLKLEKICEAIPNGSTTFHPVTPALQWENTSENRENATKKWRLQMNQKGNHYFFTFPPAATKEENRNYPKYDQNMCLCHAYEIETSNNVFKTLKASIDGNEDIINKIHGMIYYGEKHDETPRPISKELKQKILEDTLEYMGQEYKIHLQPRQEYQIPVVRILAKLLAEDKEFNSCVDTFKAIIPYHRVKSGMNLPSIVIYPVWGVENARIVLSKIIKAFDKYDSVKIGLNHTPRFNEKYNELIYYAGGAGDHKGSLPADLYTEGKKFFKGYELTL
jgi:hypothetical protein